MKGIIHDFAERLAFSQEQGDNEAAWVAFYQEAWPNALTIVRIDANSKFQQWGIDRHIYLPNGKQISVDEKVRDPARAKDNDGDPYDDILIEEWSVFRGADAKDNKVGWTLDVNKACDYIAYALPLLNRCYLLPFELLRLASQVDLPMWKTLKDAKGRKCWPLDTHNRSYITRNCAVSWPNLQASLMRQMRRVRSAGTLTLPTPTVRGHLQAEFDWTGEP